MIYELKKERFGSIKDIVHKQWDNIEIMAVLSGINTGWVFVDSLETPATALLWSKGIEGFYFIGNPDNRIQMEQRGQEIKGKNHQSAL